MERGLHEVPAGLLGHLCVKPPCEVCGGARVIRLPLHRSVAAAAYAEPLAPEPPEELSREFPCPQCAADEHMPYAQLYVQRLTHAARASLASDSEYTAAMRRQLAVDLGLILLRDGMIHFNRGIDDPGHFEFPLTATVGVVSPKHVAEFEGRVRARQFELAEQLLELTGEQIRNWGSYYHGRDGGRVDKAQALEWLQEAYRKLKESVKHA